MASLAAGFGKLAGRGVGAAAGTAAGVAGATTGFVGGIISPVIKFFSDLVDQRIKAAEKARKIREARDEKIVEICHANWNDFAEKKQETLREVGGNPPRPAEVGGSNHEAIENTPR